MQQRGALLHAMIPKVVFQSYFGTWSWQWYVGCPFSNPSLRGSFVNSCYECGLDAASAEEIPTEFLLLYTHITQKAAHTTALCYSAHT